MIQSRENIVRCRFPVSRESLFGRSSHEKPVDPENVSQSRSLIHSTALRSTWSKTDRTEIRALPVGNRVGGGRHPLH